MNICNKQSHVAKYCTLESVIFYISVKNGHRFYINYKTQNQNLIGSIMMYIAPSARCRAEMLRQIRIGILNRNKKMFLCGLIKQCNNYTYVAIVPVGMDGVSSGLPLGPYCPMKDPSSVKRPRKSNNLQYTDMCNS